MSDRFLRTRDMFLDLVKAVLQGQWLRHPLHPILVHLPSALFPAALIFDLVSRFGDGDPIFARLSCWCIAVGLIAVLGAVPTGIADWAEIKKEKPAWALTLIHASLNAAVALVFLVNLILRLRGTSEPAHVSDVQLALSVIGNAGLLVSGWLGHRIVYDHGIAIARQSKKKWRAIAEAGGARVPAPQEGK